MILVGSFECLSRVLIRFSSMLCCFGWFGIVIGGSLFVMMCSGVGVCVCWVVVG